ncbi:hypothetical protein Tco_1406237 [Tanacetum coccineum]
MAESNEYVSVTRKNFLSNDSEGRMVEKSFLEIQGTFLVKIRDNTFNGIIRENTFKYINNFLEVVGPLKIKEIITTWENLVEKFVQKLYQLFDDNDEMETDEDDDPDDIAEISKIEDNLFDFETPLYPEEPWSDYGVPYQLCDHICEPYRFKNGKTKWPTCSSDIDGFCNGGELLGMVRVRCMTYFQDHKWYDKLTDGKLKEEALMHKARFEESWGDATPGVMKFYAWLKSSFENFHELDYDVLVKLEECWWKVNAHENTPFVRWENHGQGPYANAKTKKDCDPYLDIDRIFGRNYESNNAGNIQDNMKEHHDPSIYKIRRFEMMKYLFDADDEYVAIKEREHSDHSRTNVDACQAYQ